MSYRKDMNYFLHLMQPDFYIIYNVLMYTNVFIMLGVLRLRYVFCCCCFFVLFFVLSFFLHDRIQLFVLFWHQMALTLDDCDRERHLMA